MINSSESLTIRDKSSQDHFESEPKRESRILLAEKALTIYSPAGEEREIVEMLRSELESRGLHPRIDSAGNVICEIGTGSRSILLCPHIDTVPGNLPFRREGSILHGRGASDAKGALLSMLFAFEDIADEFERDPAKKLQGRVIFAAVVEEERESKGLAQLIRDKVRADGAIFGEPGGVNRITVGYRGHLPVSFEITTREAHSSAPWITTNAAETAFFLYEVIRNRLGAMGTQGIDSISVAITKIESGTSHNIVPGSSKMSIDVRIPLGECSTNVREKVNDVSSEVERSLGCSIATIFGEATEPYRAKLDSKLARAITRSMIKLGLRPSFISKSGTGDMNTYALTFGTDALTYGPGDPKLSHTDSEQIDMEEVFSCTKVLVKTFGEFFGLSN